LTHYERVGKEQRRKRDAAEPKRTIPAREPKKVKERLNRSVKEYGTLLDAIPDPAAIVDAKGKVLAVNDGVEDLTGLKREELLGKNFRSIGILAAKTAAILEEKWAKRVKGMHVAPYEIEAITKDGKKFTLQVNVAKIEYQREPAGLVLLSDITERKRMEEALRRQADLLQKTFDSMTDAVFILDAKGVRPLAAPAIVECNEAASVIFGYEKEEMLGKTTAFLHVSDETLRKFQLLLYSAVEKGFLPFHLPEYGMKRKDGSIFPSEHMVAQMLNDEGERIGWVSIVRDITDRKRPEEETRRLSQFLSLVVDSADVWLDVLDAKGNVLIWNKAAEAVSGYSREEVVGHKKIWEWLYPEEKYRKEMTDKAASIIQGLATDVEDETTIRTKSGEYKIISWHSRNIVDEKGVPIGSVALGHDITERKKMQEQIESLARFPSENPNPVLRLSQDGILLDANEATDPLLQDWGCKVGSVAPKFWRDLAREAVASQSDRSVDLEVGERVYSFFVKPVKDAGYVNLYGTDITERKRMEEILRRSEQEKTAILENMSELVTYLDTENRILWGNRAVTESLGLDLQQVIGRRCYETWHQRKIPCTDCPVNKACKTGQHQEGEITTPDGRVWLTRADPVRDANGEVVGIIEVSEEITERRKMEEELKERNAQQTVVSAILEEFTRSIDLKEILEESVKKIKDYTQCSSVGIRLLDDDGNIPYEAYVGFSTEFYGSESPLSIKSDKCMCINVIKGNCDPSKPFFTANGSFYANGTSKLLATVSEEEKGETRNVCNEFGYESVSLSPIRVGDRIVGLIHVADEKENMVPLKKVEFLEKIAAEISLGVEKARITSKLRESQERLRKHSEQLEELVKERTKELQMQQEALLRSERLAAIGEAAAMVGHDLRNPLQAMVNMLYLGRKRLESIPPQLRELAEKYGIPELMEGAGDQIEYMNKIVSDLQDYAKEVEPKLVETSISGLIDETLSMTSIPENVKISVVVEKGLPKLIVDPALMKRVFTNLVINALEAMPDGGRLKIEASVKGEEALIDFHDTGVGIAEENLDKMFQPLFTTRAKGMGLGLVVAKRLVEAHSGEITIRSKVGEGSAFTVKLPLRKE